jgi:glutamate formiminotransferase / 5-formyltetrahydrofolate cyclo-ligase
VLECVVNVSEGTDGALVAQLGAAAGPKLLDSHADADHNRSVLTLAGAPRPLHDATAAVTRLAVAGLDVTQHAGVHPRLGVVDVVPFVDLDDPWARWTAASLAARLQYATWAADELGLPCFLYGPERTLPEIRRTAWRTLSPDVGPDHPHPTAGAVCVGARGVLVAYNLLVDAPMAVADEVARQVRRPGLRTLAFVTAAGIQVSCNLTEPARLGPADVYDLVAAAVEQRGARVIGTELVGLLPAALLARIPEARWPSLGIGPQQTIEARVRHAPA